MNPQIVFIGGTGRCGTNILKDMFARHSRIATLPFESRFFIDPDGLVDFYSSYTASWSPFMASIRIVRLRDLLYDVSRKGSTRYPDWELEKYFPNFDLHTGSLLNQLSNFSYTATKLPHRQASDIVHHGNPKSKEQLAAIIGNYIRDLISDFLQANNADLFVDDNTWNILHARQLLDFVPTAKIIHICRHPMDVVASMIGQRWTPDDLAQVTLYYKSIMKYWAGNVAWTIPLSSYYRIRFEDLINDPQLVIQHACEFIDIPYEPAMINLDLSQHNIGRWKQDFTADEALVISEILGPMISDLGYTLE